MQQPRKKYLIKFLAFKLVLIGAMLHGKLYAQLYFPNASFYNTEIERLNIHSDSSNFYESHLSLKPILDQKTNPDVIYHSDGDYYYWITQKLFKENFLIFKGDDFWVSVDPIVDLELGTDFAQDSLTRLYWNTRGIRVQAKFFDKVAFTTSVYENQALVPQYQADYFEAHGEFRPTNQGYKQENAFVPMYARTKPFKVNGFDFAFAEGQLSIVPTNWLNFQFGNGNQFVGDGYRSLFLSDFSGNYPFLKSELLAFNGRLQYDVTYALLTNLYRMTNFTTPEAIYERKIGVFHFLDFAVTKNFNLNFFNGSNWRRTDSLGTHQPDFLFLNPVIGVNSLVLGTENSGYNSILGVGGNYRLKNFKFYTQFLLSHKAWQFGVKAYDLFVDKLDVQMEYNSIDKNTYLTDDVKYNYTHNNLALGHPFGPGTQEIIGILNYQFDRFFVRNKTVFYAKSTNDSLNIGANLLQPKVDLVGLESYHSNVFNNHFEIGYRMNKNYNLQISLGYLYRNEIIKQENFTTHYVFVGLKTKLRNKTLDW